jgi:hypothetical protein
MLGEKIGEEHGKVTGRRVLPGDADVRWVTMEISYETQGTLLGQAGRNASTYTIVERGPGQIYGTGQGIFMTLDGQAAIWNGHGVARVDATGSIHVAASVAFQTTSEKLAKLNGVLVLVEHHTDMENNASSDLFEWSV